MAGLSGKLDFRKTEVTVHDDELAWPVILDA
jgi:hypothetical protein